jgi:hypothetical protein
MTKVLQIQVTGQEGALSFIRAENDLGTCADTSAGRPYFLAAEGGSPPDDARLFAVPSGTPAILGDRVLSIARGLTAQIVDRDLTSGLSYGGAGADFARMMAGVPGMRVPLPALPNAWAAAILSTASGHRATKSAVVVEMPGLKSAVVIEGGAQAAITKRTASTAENGLEAAVRAGIGEAPAASSASRKRPATQAVSDGPAIRWKATVEALQTKVRSGLLTQAQFDTWCRVNPCPAK